MKLKNPLLVFLFFAFQSLSAQTAYYYYYNQKKYIDIDREFVAVNAVTNQNFLQSFASSYVHKTDFYKSNVRTSVTPVDSLAISRVSLQNYYSELQLTAAIKNDTLNYQNFINTLHQNPDVIKVSPCIRATNGNLVGLTNYFYVKLHTAADESILYTLAQSHNLEVIGKNPYMPLWYAISCTKQNPLSVLEYANLFYESGFFEAAEPEFVYHGGNAGSTEPIQNNAQSANSVVSSPDDMFYADQWGLKNTGQHNSTPGIDIKAEQAWAFIQNNVPVPGTIKIAIYDEGFDTNHPDLAGNVSGNGYDINTEGNAELRAGQHHGTHCAGIAGAVQNNIGISGVAPQAKLVSISHDSDNRTSAEIAAGFTWARDNQIDVISCSWDANGLESSLITNAINSALTSGRGGLGCVVVFCSGNSQTPTTDIVYPAGSELVPNVLVVGAISPCGERLVPGTCEWGSGGSNYLINLWRSRYGSRLDVVAPGVRIPTTDAQGDVGSNPDASMEAHPAYASQPNYWSAFNGTSAATPHVAGIAALVLSVNPQLTAVQVNNIIEQTAQKTGGYDYAQTTGRPNGTWHEEMGYGLVDAYAAVQLAQSMATLDLMVKDSQEDLGIEPNTVTQYFWASPDIWIRNQDDNGLTHQNPEYSPTVPNYAYIRITNKSLIASSGNEHLKFYWAKAGTSLNWPDSWNGTSTFANNALKGNEVGTVNIPVIQPGQTKIVKMPFLVPNPDDYSFAGSDQWHFCLLARIVATDDPIISETNDLVSNVSKSNNIAWKNVTIVYAVPDSEGKLGGVIAVGNPFNEIRTFNLNFEADNKEMGKLIFEEAEVTVHLDDILINAWEKGGKQGNNVISRDKNILMATGDNASLNNLIFDENETGTLFLQFNFLTKEITDKEIYKYHVVQRHASTNNIFGGETYEIRKDPRSLFYADAGDDKYIDKNETIVLIAEPINEPAVYNWYDNDGNLIYEGANFEVSVAVAKKYKLEIIALADGYKDYTEIEVKLNPNRIETVYPNPSSNQVTTTYKINEGDSAYLALTGFYGSNISNNYILDITQNEITVDISSYPQGLYNIALIVNGQVADTKTVVKQ